MTVATVVPFGVEVGARTPVSTETIDEAVLVYDEQQQIMFIREGESDALMPWCRHTDGPTSSKQDTDGRGGPEYDTDHRED